MNSMLRLGERAEVDDSIKSYERFGYLPISGTNLNTANPIVIRVENSDNFFRPCDSEIQFEGKVTKAAGVVITKAEALTALINNGLLFLFDNIKYELSGNEIESIYHPGQALTMFGLLTKNISHNDGGGLISGWAIDDDDGTAKDTNNGWNNRRNILFKNNVTAEGEEDTNSGSFRFSIRLDDIFGWCSDYRKVMYGFVHSLTLIRNVNNNDALLKSATGPTTEVTFSKISWILPSVEPSDVSKYELLKQINDQQVLSVDFRVRQCATTTVPESTSFFWRLGIRSSPEKPRYLILGFQTDREGDQTKNLGLFDHCKLANTYVLLNNQRYPAMDYHTDFDKNHYDCLYREFYSFLRKYHGVDDSVTSTAVDPIAYKHLFPIIVYDVSKQSERIKQAVVDITIQCYFKSNVGAKTKAYCLMISDRRLKFKSDGNKMNIVY